jgi:predicted RNase H-like HicB family nuclease
MTLLALQTRDADVTAYIAFVHPPEDGSEWGVTFPDLGGCVSAGPSFERAVEAAQEALSGHLALLAADGDPLPKARTLSQLQADPAAAAEATGAITQLVAPAEPMSERVRVDLSLDRGLLQRADEAARARGLSRTAFIEVALSAEAGRSS